MSFRYCSQSSSRIFESCLVLLGLVLYETQVVSSALILSLRNHHSQHHHRRPMIQTNQSTCALFVGNWVRDDSYPLYQSSDCAIIDPEFNCQMNGRPDSDYLKYRWEPLNCELPGFNGVEFLEKMKGKRVMFVGDSLGRNQWESLICMIGSSVPQTSTQMSRGDPLSTFRFLVTDVTEYETFTHFMSVCGFNKLRTPFGNYEHEYGVSISYFRAPYLVDIDVYQGKRVLKLEEISGNANAWRSADVLLFNTGHWWSHKGSLQEWDYMESGGTYYQDMDRSVALEKGLRTWAHWIDSNIDTSTTRVFFQSISPTHYNPSEWSAGTTTATTRNCYGETSPMKGATYPIEFTDIMRVIDDVIRDMNVPVYLLDITMLSELRKDGHPSIYSGDLNPQQRANPATSADCSHWCLPGLPDTWNQLFYTALFF